MVAAQFELAHSFSEGLAAVRILGKWGYIDTSGTLQIPAILPDEPGDFSGGYATAGPERRLVYMDRTGRSMLGPFLEATPFVHGLAAVRRRENEVEYIDANGRTVFRYRPKR